MLFPEGQSRLSWIPAVSATPSVTARKSGEISVLSQKSSNFAVMKKTFLVFLVLAFCTLSVQAQQQKKTVPGWGWSLVAAVRKALLP